MGAPRSPCPFAGASPSRPSPSAHRLASAPPRGPHPGRCPAPTAARKDAARVPSQASARPAPPRQECGWTAGVARAPGAGRQAGRWPQLAGAWVSSCLFRRASNPGALFPSYLLVPKFRFEIWNFIYFSF